MKNLGLLVVLGSLLAGSSVFASEQTLQDCTAANGALRVIVFTSRSVGFRSEVTIRAELFAGNVQIGKFNGLGMRPLQEGSLWPIQYMDRETKGKNFHLGVGVLGQKSIIRAVMGDGFLLRDNDLRCNPMYLQQ